MNSLVAVYCMSNKIITIYVLTMSLIILIKAFKILNIRNGYIDVQTILVDRNRPDPYPYLLKCSSDFLKILGGIHMDNGRTWILNK